MLKEGEKYMWFWIFGIMFIVMILVFVIVFYAVSKKEKYIKTLTETGPFSIATIENVEKKLKKNSDRIGHYYYECQLTYLDTYGNDRNAVIGLPYNFVPEGGELKIAYNPEDYEEVYFVEALFMNTPEYIEYMEENGYERVLVGGTVMYRKKDGSGNKGLFRIETEE